MHLRWIAVAPQGSLACRRLLTGGNWLWRRCARVECRATSRHSRDLVFADGPTLGVHSLSTLLVASKRPVALAKLCDRIAPAQLVRKAAMVLTRGARMDKRVRIVVHADPREWKRYRSTRRARVHRHPSDRGEARGGGGQATIEEFMVTPPCSCHVTRASRIRPDATGHRPACARLEAGDGRDTPLDRPAPTGC